MRKFYIKRQLLIRNLRMPQSIINLSIHNHAKFCIHAKFQGNCHLILCQEHWREFPGLAWFFGFLILLASSILLINQCFVNITQSLALQLDKVQTSIDQIEVDSFRPRKKLQKIFFQKSPKTVKFLFGSGSNKYFIESIIFMSKLLRSCFFVLSHRPVWKELFSRWVFLIIDLACMRFYLLNVCDGWFIMNRWETRAFYSRK